MNLVIYNILGEEIATSVKVQKTDYYKVEWNDSNPADLMSNSSVLDDIVIFKSKCNVFVLL